REQWLERQQQVTAAQQEEAAAAETYTAKIHEVLATGWATPQGLALQGHEAPKPRKRGATSTKRDTKNEAAEQDSPAGKN
ncbi:MAG: hypothetical protein PHQ28_00005, partial [Mycobacterium sp.]|nr:hypothetical protein [Mycobacterium sp.]